MSTKLIQNRSTSSPTKLAGCVLIMIIAFVLLVELVVIAEIVDAKLFHAEQRILIGYCGQLSLIGLVELLLRLLLIVAVYLDRCGTLLVFINLGANIVGQLLLLLLLLVLWAKRANNGLVAFIICIVLAGRQGSLARRLLLLLLLARLS